MSQHLANRRNVILEGLKQELMGPAPAGKAVSLGKGQVTFEKKEDAYGAWFEEETGEEILTRDGPRVRYGVGILYPAEDPAVEQDPIIDQTQQGSGDSSDEMISEKAATDIEKFVARSGEAQDDDFELSSANAYQPSAMAVSFLLSVAECTGLKIKASGGRYEQFKVLVGKREQIWWKRIPVCLEGIVPLSAFATKRHAKVSSLLTSTNAGKLSLSVELFIRDYAGDDDKRLVTVSVINRTTVAGNFEERCLFQSYLEISPEAPSSGGILPYPRADKSRDEEEESLELLYRDSETFAVGHGCAADWTLSQSKHQASTIFALPFPSFEAPLVTPDIVKNGKKLEVPMAILADASRKDESLVLLHSLLKQYREWIGLRDQEVNHLSVSHQKVAARHIAACTSCANRIQSGLELIEGNDKAYLAFRLANEAVLAQQIQSKRETRSVSFDRDAKRFHFSRDYEEPDLKTVFPDRGQWRPFQIAFLLLAIPSTADRTHPDRDKVDLIWFPTGGGKTEAYLGLAAFSIFYSRLTEGRAAGVNVLMRYTLRLLTAQQFQRASALVCAMELIRRKHIELLADTPISIGIWLGQGVTPNSNEQAHRSLRELQNRDSEGINPFLVTRCPWCGATMGRYSGVLPSSVPRVRGYEWRDERFTFHCPDSICAFADKLPIYVVDEQIYETRPSYVIATVDKFASLAWSDKPRALFGLGESGHRLFPPINLIIQDELHLISGPLGSVFGLYEALIEDLCTVVEDGTRLRPKIIASTATIRRFQQQIRDLYDREDSELFPPPGLSVADSFFARYAVDENGVQKPGRLYVGVFAVGLGSLQTAEQRTYAALAQAPMALPEAERDPWWTLLLFFNSLRELGTSLSMLQSDVITYLRAIGNRKGIPLAEMRHLNQIRELTSRLRNDEVPKALDDLAIQYKSGRAIDVCLASNIIEVGVDIDRLGLMGVVGQPKSTAQYIQVTGRVGRRPTEPGMVATIYAVSKPRDRSHYEKFRTYHEKLYAQVEPTSATPFCSAVLQRALHAVLIGFVRQRGKVTDVKKPQPFPDALLKEIADCLRERVARVDPDQSKDLEAFLTRRLDEWDRWKRMEWTSNQPDLMPFIREAGAYVPPHWEMLTWSTPRSMRNVDAECGTQITMKFLAEEQ